MKTPIRRLATALSVAASALCTIPGGAAPPRLLPFQGRLTDASGVTVADGAKVLQFKIYDAPTGGTAIWGGEIQKVSLNGGLASTVLGSKASLDNVNFNESIYLEITIDANDDGQISAADPPLLPRQSVLPAVFAVEAREARTLEAGDGESYGWSALFGNQSPASGTIPINRVAIPTGGIAPAAIAATEGLVTSQVAPGAVTSSRLAPTARLEVGAIIMHHTFNGAAPVPRGWLTCDGAAINQARYDAEHGPGAFSEDEISASPLLNKLLPDFNNRYPVGAIATPHPGTTAFPTVGNASSSVNLSHTHTIPAHKHQWINTNGNGYSLQSWNSAGNLVTMGHDQPNTGFRMVQNTAQEGTTGDYHTSSTSQTSNTALSPTNIQPESIAVRYIIKIR